MLLSSLALSPVRAETNKDLLALGEYLSSECVACHQLSGEYNGIPSIIGWETWLFQSVMNEYRDKTRSHALMQTIAASLSDKEVKALALYFGSIEPK